MDLTATEHNGFRRRSYHQPHSVEDVTVVRQIEQLIEHEEAPDGGRNGADARKGQS